MGRGGGTVSDSPLDGAGKILGREVGGIPVAGWLAIVGAGYFVGRKLVGGFGGGGGGGTGVPFVDPNSTGYTASGEPASSGDQGGEKDTIADNSEWRRVALDYLQSIGVKGADAERAVSRYLNGYTLTAADEATINTVIRRIGAPPESVPTPVGSPVVTPPGAGRSPRSTTVLAPYGLGENANQVASRIRRTLGVTTTPTGAPLTGAYLVKTNGLNVGVTRALRKGTRIVY